MTHRAAKRSLAGAAGLALAAALMLFGAGSCAKDARHVASEDDARPPPEKGPRRVAITRKLLDDYQISPSDLAELQLYLRGRIVLRREVAFGTREITKQHTLRVVEGHTYDELTVESGTPGVEIAQQGVKVNFDPGDPDSGFVFEQSHDDFFKFRADPDPGEKNPKVDYGTGNYDVLAGTGAFLEIDAENLKNFATHEKKLPGAVLSP